jgi:hypothetical protein
VTGGHFVATVPMGRVVSLFRLSPTMPRQHQLHHAAGLLRRRRETDLTGRRGWGERGRASPPFGSGSFLANRIKIVPPHWLTVPRSTVRGELTRLADPAYLFGLKLAYTSFAKFRTTTEDSHGQARRKGCTRYRDLPDVGAPAASEVVLFTPKT